MSTPEYQVLCADTSNDLASLVREYLEDGWLPQGGIAIDSEGWAFQAMFRIKGAVRTQVVSVVDEASGDE